MDRIEGNRQDDHIFDNSNDGRTDERAPQQITRTSFTLIPSIWAASKDLGIYAFQLSFLVG